MPKACPYAMALSFDMASYPGMILYLCLGVLGGIVVVFWVACTALSFKIKVET